MQMQLANYRTKARKIAFSSVFNWPKTSICDGIFAPKSDPPNTFKKRHGVAYTGWLVAYDVCDWLKYQPLSFLGYNVKWVRLEFVRR